ncbi:MAG: aspartate aminotransferase family protein [Myxococcales bacterium]|nr:aspartate aminotransferase family protein [Myxococcales bacterium]MCB9643457.1 aspartate aminotransferase family protein [Myxococcales bacterium]
MQEIMAQEERYQLKTYKKFPFALAKGEGAWVTTTEGDRYLDLYGGHAVVSTGHCHPHVVKAIQEQAASLMFYSNLVYHETRAQAAAMLAQAAPEGLEHVFFVNSGAEANDNALKLARHYSGKLDIISFEGGFHGRTTATLSATGSTKYRDAFPPKITQHHFVPFGDLAAVEALFAQHEIGGVLLEPIQSMAGVKMADASFYQGLRALCDQHGALLIYDEVQTGFGRTGEQLFFAPRFGVIPDLITLAKGIASGVPMGALLLRKRYAEQINYGDLGTTFGGGPLASAALKATLEVIQQEDLLGHVARESAYLREQLLGIDGVQEVLGMGFLMGIRFASTASVVQKKLLAKKIITGLSDDPEVMRLLPPLILARPEIDLFLQTLKDCLSTPA